ncbi:MAG: hypothetical protein ACFFFG_17270 [Candidatus Thorarchaeota archaeon]
MKLNHRKSALFGIMIAIILAGGFFGVLYWLQSPTNLQIELNPSSPVSVQSGSSFALEISVRITSGFKPPARHVRGELELPEGFIEDSLQTRTRQLTFGTIWPGDASHYGLTIIVSDTVTLGECQANLTIWGENIPKEVILIQICVNSSNFPG